MDRLRFALWSKWWLGDAVGAVIVAPLMVLLITQPLPRWKINHWIEAGLLFGGLFVVSAILFIPSFEQSYPLTFIYIPFLFGPRFASARARPLWPR